MEMLILLSVLAMVVITAVGIAFVILALLILLILAGAASGGALVGLYKRSVQNGFRTFVALIFAFLGAFLGALIFWAIPTIQHWFVENKALLPLGGACLGFMMGYGVGVLNFLLFRKVLRGLLKRLVNRLKP